MAVCLPYRGTITCVNGRGLMEIAKAIPLSSTNLTSLAAALGTRLPASTKLMDSEIWTVFPSVSEGDLDYQTPAQKSKRRLKRTFEPENDGASPTQVAKKIAAATNDQVNDREAESEEPNEEEAAEMEPKRSDGIREKISDSSFYIDPHDQSYAAVLKKVSLLQMSGRALAAHPGIAKDRELTRALKIRWKSFFANDFMQDTTFQS